MLWYYAKNNQQLGPVEETELRRLIAAGEVGRDNLVWMSDFPDWRRAGEVPALFPQLIPPPVPVPATALVDPPPAAPEPYQPYQPPKTDLSTYQPPPAYGAAPDGAPTGTGYASFGMRFAAFLLDSVIVTGVSLIVGIVIGVALALAGAMGRGGLSPGASLVINLFSLVFNWLYYALSESSALQGTLGKRALGLIVTDLHGNRIDFGRASGRYFGKILSGLALGIGYLAILNSPRHQAWHDRMADCLVLRTR